MKRLAASGFGLGWLPLAPGSWGSLPPAIIFALMSYLGASSAMITILMAVLALAGSVISVKCAPASIAATGDTDPNEVVADEIAGQAITFALAGSFVSGPVWWAPAVGGFFLFRLFDVIKPCPARRLEKLPRGWGILADDIVAGLYAGISLAICLQLWVRWPGG
jgi:phosphatidylglycerophosphatase A